MRTRYLVPLCLLVLVCSACADRSLGTHEPLAPPTLAEVPELVADGDALAPKSVHPLIAAGRLGRPVDLLFVVDDSSSMEPKQWSLRQRFGRLIDRLRAEGGDGYDLHVGVTTTDVGTPGYDCGHARGGVLTRKGAIAADACGELSATAPYLTYQSSTGATNAPSGAGIVDAFGCLAAAGSLGCGYEMPLEAAYRVLATDDTGFVRPDATLVLVLVTDEDDCSVDDPASALFASVSDAVLGPRNSFRCARFGVVCDGALLPDQAGGPYERCRPAEPSDGGKLASVEKYARLFFASRADGGLKDDPDRVVFATLAAAATSISTVRAEGHQACGTSSTSCTQLAPSCVRGDRKGDPALRLAALATQGSRVVQASICDDDYADFFDAIGNAITTLH